MILLSQNDPRWKGIKLGTSNVTIGGYGCTITCIAMIVGTTPDVVNKKLLEVGGYAEGNLVIWAKIEEAFKGITVRRVWTYNNDDIKNNLPAIVEVDGAPIGGSRHFVVYVGNQKCYDPWDGHEDPTSDYPNPLSYAILGGKWEGQTEPMVTLSQRELDAIRLARDTHYNEKVELQKQNLTLSKKLEEEIQHSAEWKAQDARDDYDLGLKNLALESRLRDTISALGLAPDTTQELVLETITGLRKPHEELIKNVIPLMDKLADAAIFKRNKKAKSLLDKIRGFFIFWK